MRTEKDVECSISVRAEQPEAKFPIFILRCRKPYKNVGEESHLCPFCVEKRSKAPSIVCFLPHNTLMRAWNPGKQSRNLEDESAATSAGIKASPTVGSEPHNVSHRDS